MPPALGRHKKLTSGRDCNGALDDAAINEYSFPDMKGSNGDNFNDDRVLMVRSMLEVILTLVPGTLMFDVGCYSALVVVRQPQTANLS
jgi:hypothetical protein